MNKITSKNPFEVEKEAPKKAPPKKVVKKAVKPKEEK
jgi:hypothetical protein